MSYQRFKFDVIARLDQHQPWSITARQIDEWADLQRQHEAGPQASAANSHGFGR